MKGKILIGACAIVLAVVVFLLVQESSARRWESRWREFVTYWQAEGEWFDSTMLTPPGAGGDGDFVGHPYIRKMILGEVDVSPMMPDHVEDYLNWESDTDEDGIVRPMPPELAQKILKHVNSFDTELSAFADAAHDPEWRIAANDLEWSQLASRLHSIGSLLGAAAHSAAALGDSPSLTRHLETLSRVGNVLRSSNRSLGVVVGSGFEARAVAVIRGIPKLQDWPESDRRKWLTALDLRTRGVADEFAATSRSERNRFLAQMDSIARNGDVPLGRGWRNSGTSRRIFFNRSKLAACESLQYMVLSDGTHLSKVIDPTRIAHFQDHLKSLRDSKRAKKNHLDPAEEVGLATQFAVIGIQDALILLEADRADARTKVQQSLR